LQQFQQQLLAGAFIQHCRMSCHCYRGRCIPPMCPTDVKGMEGLPLAAAPEHFLQAVALLGWQGIVLKSALSFKIIPTASNLPPLSNKNCRLPHGKLVQKYNNNNNNSFSPIMNTQFYQPQ